MHALRCILAAAERTSDGGPDTTSQIPPRAAAPRPADILVVEDNPNLRRTIAEALYSEGYAVLSAADGVDALRVLNQADPWLILMGRRLPRLDTKEFLHEVRRRRMKAKAVIVTGAEDASEAVEELQADGYLAKPFELDELFTLVERYSPKKG
jgi:DNA-binding response OmpR family regulator